MHTHMYEGTRTQRIQRGEGGNRGLGFRQGSGLWVSRSRVGPHANDAR